MTRVSLVRQVMGMPVSVHLRGTASAEARQRAGEAAYAELREADRVFSTYRPDSDIRRLDRGQLALGGCDPAVAEVLALAEEARRRTGGYFHVRLPAPGGGWWLDPSGLVKGWAAERAARHLAELDGDDHYLNAGGDIAVHAAPGAPPWRIGIEHPDSPATLLGVLSLRSGGVATSGTAHRGAHLVDPTTGRRPDALRSVTVVGPSLLWADVYATAAFARGDDALDWLSGLDGYEGLVLTRTGAVRATPGMRALLVHAAASAG
ncbi:MAG TPA: FAD:protein FMN transferase [Mycobacteriales bacterium]|jgi:thiamine biosynthesis lipoprotein